MNDMTDGAMAALRQHEARQDRLEAQAPTPSELEDYVDNWLEKKRKQMGEAFLTEAFCEAEDYSRIYRAYSEADHVDIGVAFDKIVRAYWVPSALKDAEGHDFNRDREA